MPDFRAADTSRPGVAGRLKSGLESGMDWLRTLLRPELAPARTGPLDSANAARVAALQAEGGFARAWPPAECAAMLADASVVADGVFCGDETEPVGFVISRAAAGEAEVISVVVARSRRGEGLGRALVRHHLDQLALRGAREVFLEVEDGNEPAERLYRHCGFREVGRRPGYYTKPDGSRVAAILMRLDLA